MSTRDSRPGSTGGADVAGPLHGGPDDDYTPEQLAAMPREELDRLGARYDGVEILHVDPGPEPGTPVERRAVRQVGLTFALAGLAALAFVVVYVGSGWFLPDWHWEITDSGWSVLFTPLLGALMGLAFILVGVGLVLYTKKLLPHETAVQDKHDGSHFDRVTTGATLVGGLHDSGLARRKLLTRSLAFMGGGLGLMLLMPLGGLIKNPNKGDPLGTTSWAEGVRLVRDDGTPIRPGDQEPGSLETVFPAVPGGNRESDAPTMLFRLRPEQVDVLRPREGHEDFNYGDYVAFSKICTHAGCPVSLYEQETSRILCPCHQSMFDITQGAKPIFGPATRPLPQLPITVDDEGYLVARSDYIEAVGPTYWNRERI
ncbi:ubiquinol-cytochrome c reductase iron-sulfur subunit [Geodermatophilus sabuli]|uniref:Cytochrome bc1 complex Rieske iron-sulfur subunit n=1 Tax=Geodermatophilus sabuli TaxID=1564158 RepID=A0A285E7A1_9ACTN|nr:Rieske 2Fe-2S domain-containing protein [Geodermatophilus sabuli]MBB3082156.1 ubiquinol-cytochrome c reductase iron-sulfur subunit [Geodermatophilus sabuli]SNX94972.1 menaquinol-cytochrome c reductase iron-sulfur subunit precursor [Geodermatophilus sabuli]